MIGFIRLVSLSIDKMENKDERPFAIRAFMAAELLKDLCISMPTCETDSAWLIVDVPSFTVAFEGVRTSKNTSDLHLAWW